MYSLCVVVSAWVQRAHSSPEKTFKLSTHTGVQPERGWPGSFWQTLNMCAHLSKECLFVRERERA